MAEPGVRLAPHQIPRMRAALDRAINQLAPALERLDDEGWIRDPWMGDEVSERMRVHFNDRLMFGENNVRQALVSYLTELQRVRESLLAAEDRYRRTEGENSELWGRV